MLSGAATTASALCFAACANSAPSPANPASPAAERINQLWWIFFAMAAVIFVIVLVVLVHGALRVPAAAEQERQHPFGTPLIWVGGVTVPLIVLGVVFLLSTRVLATYGPLSPSRLTVTVIGHRWWWEAQYAQQGFSTANELHIPTGRQVEIRLTSDDVIHDFWVPQLGGKMDAVPGAINSLTFETDKAGAYRGACLVYCGLQHTNMNFLVIVDPPAQFNAWLAGQQAAPASVTAPTIARGQQLFLKSACVYCHAVSGTNATARVGPDLTHFASRQQIGAGVLPNNAGALAGWIVNPQTSKPGNLMPPESFSGPELEDLVTFLESLK